MFNTIQQNTNTQTNTSNITISGLNIETSGYIIHLISATIGILVFYFVPLIANRFKKPLTSVLINSIPNSLILGFFLVESEFEVYLNSSIYVPLFNTFDNIISYLLFIYYNFTGKDSLTINIVFWLIIVMSSSFFSQ